MLLQYYEASTGLSNLAVSNYDSLSVNLDNFLCVWILEKQVAKFFSLTNDFFWGLIQTTGFEKLGEGNKSNFRVVSWGTFHLQENIQQVREQLVNRFEVVVSC